jgi:hypothetical protein
MVPTFGNRNSIVFFIVTETFNFVLWYYCAKRIPPLPFLNITCKQIDLLTPWCRTLFEKLIVTQPIKNILLSLWNPKVHYHVHKSPPLDPMLSQLNPVHPINPYLPKVQLNVILPPMPRSSWWSLTFRLPNQNPVNTSPLPHATCPAHLNLLDLITPTIFSEEERL